MACTRCKNTAEERGSTGGNFPKSLLRTPVSRGDRAGGAGRKRFLRTTLLLEIMPLLIASVIGSDSKQSHMNILCCILCKTLPAPQRRTNIQTNVAEPTERGDSPVGSGDSSTAQAGGLKNQVQQHQPLPPGTHTHQ